MANHLQRAASRLRREWIRAQSNTLLARMAAQVDLHSAPPDAHAAPVIFFNASTRLSGLSLNAAFSLLASWSLRLQGVPVQYVTCMQGMLHCPLGTNRLKPEHPPPCAECMLQSNKLFPTAERISFDYTEEPGLVRALEGKRLAELEAFTYQDTPLGELTLPTMRWVLRRYHLHDDEATRGLFSQFIRSAWRVVQVFTGLLQHTDGKAVVFNGQFFPEAAVRWVANQYGRQSFTHEMNLLPFSAFFTAGDATAYPLNIPAEFELNTEQNSRLDAYLEQRFRGNFLTAGVKFWNEMHNLDETLVHKMRTFRQVVPVFTNVIFDTSQKQANLVFAHMFHWLQTVLEIIKSHPDTLFVIRAHPDEARPGKAAEESVAEWVQQCGVEALPNVVFIPPQQYLSSYELISRAKFVMVYNSTIGLEAVLLGAAVLSGGKARYTQYPMVYFPQSVEAFNQQAEALLQAEQVQVPPEFVRNARRFLYYQLYRAALPFDGWIEDDGVWKGYVKLKDFDWQSLLPQHSATMQAISDGILRGGDFTLNE